MYWEGRELHDAEDILGFLERPTLGWDYINTCRGVIRYLLDLLRERSGRKDDPPENL